MFGPYVVEAAIRGGGLGVVYRARHKSTGALVAIKTLNARAPEQLAAFRREMHVLASLRHPSVARILDQGLAGRTPWYATELIEGRTLFRLLQNARAPRNETPKAASKTLLPVGETVRLLQQICRALTFLHEHGIVHRDLTPEGIVVQADGVPVLVDFAVAVQFAGKSGREVLDLTQAASGTLAYMAPEQRLGQFADARADLFSLGCILYECLAGVPPFGLAGLTGVSPQPLPLSGRLAGVPEALEAIVQRLLARDVHDRFGYADDVDVALRRIQGDGLELPAPRRTTYLYRAEFAGRRDITARFERALGDVMAGRGVKMLITGESGIGKTRLLMELGALAVKKGMRVITGECPTIGAGESDTGAPGPPLRPLRGLLLAVADACRVGGPAVAKRLLADRGKWLAPYEPALGGLCGPCEPGESEELSAEASRVRLLASVKRVVLEYAREHPLFLALDDLQWADDLSLEFVSALAPAECAGAPIAIVGTCRTEEMNARLRAWTSEPGLAHEHLDGFDRGDVKEMVGGMLSLRAPPSGLVDFVHRESEGNPFFVGEYLRAMIGEGLLVRDDQGGWTLCATAHADFREGVPLPATVRTLVERRLDGLDATAVRSVHAAAVLGRGFDVELVAATAGVEVSAALDAYASLRHRHILEEGTFGAHFAHDKLREIAYARIGPAHRAELHRRAASAIEERYAARDLDSHLGSLGHHHARAGANDLARTYFERAANCARKNYANADAIRFYRLALGQLDDDVCADAARIEARGRLNEGLGELLLLGGDASEARAAFETSLEATPAVASLDRARRRRKLARTWERQHRHAEALSIYALAEQDLGEFPGEGEAVAFWYERVQVQVDKAWDLYWLAKVDELVALVEVVRPLVDTHGLAAQRAQFFQALVHMNLRRDGYAISDDTIEAARRCLAAAAQCGDVRELALARFFLAFPLMFRGFEAEAEPLFVAAVRGAERAGDTVLQARFLSYYAILHRRLGRVDEVHATAGRAGAIASTRAMFDYLGASHAHLCWVGWRLGEPDEIARQATEAFTAWAKLPPEYAYPFQWIARMPLAAHLWESGQEDAAVEQWALLLQKGQQRLPERLRDSIEAAVRGREDPADRVARRVAALRIIALCQELRFL